ncbi:MAG TPA: four helix bundle protein [bacterium]|nr:four helix bundle protein [bacterium]
MKECEGGQGAEKPGVRKLERFEDLSVWQRAHELTLVVYRMTARFPREEQFGLVSQMRRAAVSVPANIAEGFKKRSSPDKVRFYNISQGSLEELRYYLLLSRDLGYVTNVEPVTASLDVVGRMLHGLIVSIVGRA